MKRSPRRKRRRRLWSISRRTLIKGSAAATAGLVATRYARLARGQSTPLIVDVESVPVPDFSTGNLHQGVEVLLQFLHCSGVPFYRADASHPLSDPVAGIIAPDDVVLIKVNGQWQYRGITNSDVLRGLVQRILDHPEGFTGEVVLFENGQGRGGMDGMGSTGSYPATTVGHANAEDESHTFQYLIDQVFADPRVSGYLLDPVRNNWIAADEHVADGYRDADFVSYPCFTTSRGTRVELREGIWTGTGYTQNLKLLNVPVLKHHGGSAMTGALKHTYGILSMSVQNQRRQAYHYDRIGDATADMFTLVRTPDLNIIDCIWVSHGNLQGYPEEETTRANRLLAGFDPVALDYYAGKHILYPAGGNPYHDPDNSGDYIDFMTEARDRINANGGIRGEPVTFDETEFDVVRADASAIEPAGTLRIRKQGDDARLEWEGGTPPFTVWRSATPDFADPVRLTDCCWENVYLDPGALLDETTWHYKVE